jgi:hypothetical protein
LLRQHDDAARGLSTPPDGKRRRIEPEVAADLQWDLLDAPPETADQQESFLVQRAGSARNSNAGIMDHDALGAPGEQSRLKDFFPCAVHHGGKAMNARVRGRSSRRLRGGGAVDAAADRTFADELEDLGYPFVGGASGSIEYLILSMEDDGAGKYPAGLVSDLRARETLIAWTTALLVAGGNHSVGECLAVAQAMGYFSGVPEVRGSRAETAYSGFESYARERLGVGGSTPHMSEIASTATPVPPTSEEDASTSDDY